MKICGVVSEFNPFHNGHKYLIESIKKLGYDAVICVMSGDFVQRGEYASFDKKARSKAAIDNGADLVISLPFPWSSASAEFFANGAITILNSLGVVDAIAFGSECGDVKRLLSCAEFLFKLSTDEIKEKQKQLPSLSYAEARQLLAIEALGEKDASLLSSANDILAVEYIKAAKKNCCTFDFHAIKRIESTHDGIVRSSEISSSSFIRKAIVSADKNNCFAYIPSDSQIQLETYRRICEKSYFDFLCGAVLSREPENLRNIAEIGGGFEYAVYKEALVSDSLTQMHEALKSRHITDAKIRRSLLFASVGVTKSVFNQNPQFTEVLSFNERGKEILSAVRKISEISILSKVGNIKQASEIAKEQFKLQRRAEIIFKRFVYR